MKINWSLVVLVMLGLVAAFCAALLVTTIQVQASRKAGQMISTEVEILVAGEDLKAWTVLDTSQLERQKVSRLQAPSGYFSDEALVVGRRLLTPVKAGQAITSDLFPTKGTGLELAGQLPPGMRAVSVSLKGESGLEGLIYPGCLVDVIATFKLNTNNSLGEAVSTTLLENIRVLAVEGITLAPDPDSTRQGVEEAANRRTSVARGMYVTLMLDAKQNEALQLAVDRGTVSLAMRNPDDVKQGDALATVLNQGQIASLAASLDASVPAEEDTRLVGLPPTPAPEAESPVEAQAEPDEKPEPKAEPKPEPHWTVDVIRGVSREVTELKLPRLR